jgi:hypothetical protein
MIRLTNPSPHDVHLNVGKDRTSVSVSPSQQPRVKTKVYEIVIEDGDLPKYQQFIDLKMLKAENVLPVKSTSPAPAPFVTALPPEAVVVLSTASAKPTAPVAVAPAPAPAREAVAKAAVPAGNLNPPRDDEDEPVAPAKSKPPFIPRRKA